MSNPPSAEAGTTVLPPKKNRRPLIIGVVIVAVIAIVAAILVAVNLAGAKPTAATDTDPDTGTGTGITEGLGSPDQPVRIGTVGASEPYWETFKEAALAEGISVDIIDFASYPEPNPALAAGELDLNQFQHIVYLGANNAATDDDIVPIGATAIYPLGLYSTQYDSVDAIPDGATVAIPDDPSNLARGLLVLQSAGLIELTGGGSIFATLDQVDQANSRVKVTTLEAALTVTSLPDVAAAIINNDFVSDAGLTAADAIAQDDPSDPNALPYVNIWAANAKDKDDPVLLKLVEIYQTNQDVLDGVLESSGGTAVFLKTPVADLEASLEKVIADTKAQG
jgi:D-methionine transport system substrate-binding protein